MIFASFDLDGTLINSLDLIYDGLNSIGYEVADEHEEFNLKFKEGCSPPPDFRWDLFFYRLFTERHDEIAPIDEHVGEFLRKVYYNGDEPIRVVTSRPDGVLMHWSTCALLNRLFPDITFSVDVVGSGSLKSEYTFGSDIFFEDRRKTVRELAVKGNIVFMRGDTYNELNPGEFIRIEDVSPLDLSLGDIVVYDNFLQLMGPINILGLVAPAYS